MANTLKVRRSATPGATPTTTQLSLGEIAVNTWDGKVFIKRDNGTESIVEVGAGAGGGISSLNALSGATQTFAVGTSGSDFAISSSGSTHTFNLPSASASNRGVVTTAAQEFAGTKTFNSGATTDKAIIAKGAASQTANLFEAQNSTGTALVSISSAGVVSQAVNGNTLGSLTVTTTAAGTIPLVAKGAASQTANLLEVQNSAGTGLFSIGISGNIYSAARSAIGGLAIGPAGGTTSNQNTCLGTNAARVATNTGNVSIGYNVHYNLSTGTNNVAVGYASCDALTSGYHNTAVGYYAGPSKADAFESVSIGYQAGKSNYNYMRNIFVGNGANIGSAVANVSMGIGIGHNCAVDGDYGIAVGTFSWAKGADSIAIGRSASALANCLDIRFANASRISGDSNGLIGINQSTPGAQLHVTSGAAARKGVLVKAAASATANLFETQNSVSTVLTVIDSAGKVGVGKDAPSAQLDVLSSAAGTKALVVKAAASPTTDVVNFLDGAGGTLLKLDKDGRFGFWDTAGGDSYIYFQLGTANTKSIRSANSGTVGATHYAFANGNGDVGFINTSGSGTTFQTTSDYRLKENIVDLSGALERIANLKPRRFNFKADASTVVDGFVAHELQEVVPEAVSGLKDAVKDDGAIRPQAVDYSRLTPLLAAAVKELKVENDALKERIEALEAVR
jgi:Chaperone of endosialidase/Head domain of trimeric autotransporter adhesin